MCPDFIDKSSFEIAHMKDCPGLFHMLEFSHPDTHQQRISRHSGHLLLYLMCNEYHEEDEECPLSITYKNFIHVF